MEDLGLIGNAAAVPAVIAATQLLKKNFSFKYKADVVSLVVSLIICPVWWFYTTDDLEIYRTFNAGSISTARFIIDMFLISIATWLSAAKSYDLFRGNKKREQEKQSIVDEKEVLKAQVADLEADTPKKEERGGPENDVEITNKLLEILEGRK